MATWTIQTPENTSCVSQQNETLLNANNTSITIRPNVFVSGALSTDFFASSAKATSLETVVNVFDYLTPDQINDVQTDAGSMDVTNSVQNAITAGLGKVLYFPKGTYRINTFLYCTTSNTVFKGAGKGLSVLKKGSSDPSSILFIYPSSGISNIEITGLTFDSNNYSVSGLKTRYVSDLRIKNCLFCNSTNSSIISLLIDWDSPPLAINFDILIDTCTFSNIAGWDVVIRHADRVSIRNCLFSNSTATGAGISWNQYESNCSFTNVNTPMNINYTANNIKIVNCTFTTGSSGIALSNGVGTIVRNILFDKCKFFNSQITVRGNLENVKVLNSFFDGSAFSFSVGFHRGFFCSGCEFRNLNTPFYIQSGNLKDFVWENCVFLDYPGGSAFYPPIRFVAAYGPIDGVLISGCIFTNVGGGGAIAFSHLFNRIRNITINRCTFPLGQTSIQVTSFGGINEFENCQVINCSNVTNILANWKNYSTPHQSTSLPTSGTWIAGNIIQNLAPTSGSGDVIGWTCIQSGSFGTYTEGITATANGTSGLVLSGTTSAIVPGHFLTVRGIPSIKVLSINGTSMTVGSNVSAGTSSLTFSNPVFSPFGFIGTVPTFANISASTAQRLQLLLLGGQLFLS